MQSSSNELSTLVANKRVYIYIYIHLKNSFVYTEMTINQG